MNVCLYLQVYRMCVLHPHPQVVAQLCSEHLFELSPAQRVFVPLVARVLMKGLDHKLHGVLQGGGVLWVGQRHSAERRGEDSRGEEETERGGWTDHVRSPDFSICSLKHGGQVCCKSIQVESLSPPSHSRTRSFSLCFHTYTQTEKWNIGCNIIAEIAISPSAICYGEQKCKLSSSKGGICQRWKPRRPLGSSWLEQLFTHQ